MNLDEIAKTEEDCKNLIDGIFGIIALGIIFHILGLLFDIFTYLEIICCWGTLFVFITFVFNYFYLVSIKLISNEYLSSIIFVSIFLISGVLAGAIYANVKQVDRVKVEQRQQFERECAQNTQSIIEKEVTCKALAMDWRDTQTKIAWDTKDKMAGTLAIGTAIILDGMGATLSYPIELLKGNDAKFGGSKGLQDLVIKMGLYKVPYYSPIFESRLSFIYKNIFVTVCIIIMCFMYIWMIVGWHFILLDGIKFLLKKVNIIK